jgi:hypothetical protein
MSTGLSTRLDPLPWQRFSTTTQSAMSLHPEVAALLPLAGANPGSDGTTKHRIPLMFSD